MKKQDASEIDGLVNENEKEQNVIRDTFRGYVKKLVI